MKYFQAGYYLVASRPYSVSPGEEQAKTLLLPTVSTCINATFPDTWALSWTGKSAAQLEQLASEYGITGAKLQAIQAWGDASLDRLPPEPAPFGWPNVLSSLAAARGFYAGFLSPLPLRLLGLFLPQDQLEIAQATFKPGTREGACGMYLMLRQSLPETTEAGELLGYEIMGIEIGGSLHSFYCNYLQQDYLRLGCAFTPQGLLASEADAFKALEFTLEHETHAEPVPWLSFRVKEFALA